MQEVIKKRHEIVVAYCDKMGWKNDPATLTIEQVMKIRSLKEWKEVPKLVSDSKSS
jgi:hypothetical protein